MTRPDRSPAEWKDIHALFGFPALAFAAALLALAVLARWLRLADGLRHEYGQSQVIWSDFRARQLGRYYLPNSVSPGDFAELDPRGVRVVNFAKRPTIGKAGTHYVLAAIDQYGLGSWDLWLETRDPRHLAVVRAQADWLVANLALDDLGFGVWLHDYDVGGEHQVRAPWVSALAQGISISLLTRAHQASGDAGYLQTATRALGSFEVPIEDGGVRSLDDAGYVFYEEMPGAPPLHILNGHIFALLGIHDYWRATGAARADALFGAGLETLTANLARYDTGSWSRYSLNGERNLANHFTLASPLYHRLHIDMLRILHAITGQPVLGEYADRWESYLGRPFDLGIRLAYAAFRDVVLTVKRAGFKP